MGNKYKYSGIDIHMALARIAALESEIAEHRAKIEDLMKLASPPIVMGFVGPPDDEETLRPHRIWKERCYGGYVDSDFICIHCMKEECICPDPSI